MKKSKHRFMVTAATLVAGGAFAIACSNADLDSVGVIRAATTETPVAPPDETSYPVEGDSEEPAQLGSEQDFYAATEGDQGYVDDTYAPDGYTSEVFISSCVGGVVGHYTYFTVNDDEAPTHTASEEGPTPVCVGDGLQIVVPDDSGYYAYTTI